MQSLPQIHEHLTHKKQRLTILSHNIKSTGNNKDCVHGLETPLDQLYLLGKI